MLIICGFVLGIIEFVVRLVLVMVIRLGKVFVVFLGFLDVRGDVNWF